MNIWELMDQYLDDYSPKEKKVYDLIKKEPYSFASSTAMEIAEKYKISQSSVSRFCKRLGFNGYTDFRMSLVASSHPSIESDTTRYSDVLADYIRLISQSLDNAQLDRIIDRFENATIYCSGYGMSDIAAYYLSFKLMILNLKAVHIPSSYEIEFLHFIQNKDVIFLFSASNPTHKDFFAMLKDVDREKWPYIVLLCNNKNHPFKKFADETIVLPDQSLINSPYFLDTGISQMDFVQLFADHCKTRIAR